MSRLVGWMVAVAVTAPGGSSLGGDDIYVRYGADGVPSFSTQPYTEGHALYLHDTAISDNTTRSETPEALRNAPTLHTLIFESARKQGIDPALVTAVVAVESNFDPAAISPKGAIGAMQLTASTAYQYGVQDALDPAQNLGGGIRYLKDLLVRYEGNVPLALAAYNAGPANVLRYGKRIPPFTETMLYVPRVLARMAAYRRSADDAQ